MPDARSILLLVGMVFVGLALGRVLRGGGWSHPQTRTWLLVGVIFVIVAAFLTGRT